MNRAEALARQPKDDGHPDDDVAVSRSAANHRIYHDLECGHSGKRTRQITRKEAKNNQWGPCKWCILGREPGVKANYRTVSDDLLESVRRSLEAKDQI